MGVLKGTREEGKENQGIFASVNWKTKQMQWSAFWRPSARDGAMYLLVSSDLAHLYHPETNPANWYSRGMFVILSVKIGYRNWPRGCYNFQRSKASPHVTTPVGTFTPPSFHIWIILIILLQEEMLVPDPGRMFPRLTGSSTIPLSKVFQIRHTASDYLRL